MPSLEELLRSKHEVVAVLTRPDAAAGRGRQLGPSPVARCAAEAGIEVLKPVSPRDPAFQDRLRALAPDCCPVTAYGALIPRAALEIPPHGWVNLHFSLLPAWRGAAPVPHAIWHGDDMTGATTFQLVAELDAGPVYGMMTEPIGPGDTAGDLLARLATAGAGLLAQTLDGIESGGLRAVPQPAEGISYAPKLTTDDARVRWGDPALAVGRQIRACTPAPGAWTMLGDGRLKLWPVRGLPAGAAGAAAAPGGAAGHQDPQCWQAPLRTPWNSATSSRAASGACPPPNGPADCGPVPGNRGPGTGAPGGAMSDETGAAGLVLH